MRSSSILCSLILLLACSCNYNEITGSGNIITDDRSAGAFSSIVVGQIFNVTIRQGTNARVTVRADDNVLPQIVTATTGGVLSIKLRNGSYQRVTAEVDIILPQLNGLEINNAAKATLDEFVAVNPLDIVLNNATSLSMTGSTPVLNLVANDASKVSGFGFTAVSCTVRLEDASNAEITVTDELKGSLTDAAELRYRGTPKVNVSTSDASRVIKAN